MVSMETVGRITCGYIGRIVIVFHILVSSAV